MYEANVQPGPLPDSPFTSTSLLCLRSLSTPQHGTYHSLLIRRTPPPAPHPSSARRLCSHSPAWRSPLIRRPSPSPRRACALRLSHSNAAPRTHATSFPPSSTWPARRACAPRLSAPERGVAALRGGVAGKPRMCQFRTV